MPKPLQVEIHRLCCTGKNHYYFFLVSSFSLFSCASYFLWYFVLWYIMRCIRKRYTKNRKLEIKNKTCVSFFDWCVCVNSNPYNKHKKHIYIGSKIIFYMLFCLFSPVFTIVNWFWLQQEYNETHTQTVIAMEKVFFSFG